MFVTDETWVSEHPNRSMDWRVGFQVLTSARLMSCGVV